jgi:transposase
VQYERVVAVDAATQGEQEDALRRRVAELESALTSATDSLSKTAATLAKVTAERDKLRHAYELLKGQLELLRRRIFLAQAERIDTQQLELEFAETKARLDKLAKQLGAAAAVPDSSAMPPDPKQPGKRTKPLGRRDLAAEDLPEERVEITDPALEGTAERIGFEVSYKLGRRRGGPVRIAMARVKYKVTNVSASPSLIAHLLTKRRTRSSRRRCPKRSWTADCSRRRSSRTC